MKQLSEEQGYRVNCRFRSLSVSNPEECERQALACCVNNVGGEWFDCTVEHAIKCVEESLALKGVLEKMPVKDIVKIAPFDVTEEQRQWVDDECVITKESQATVMRKLIQEKIDNES
jgi:hypothetical protein